MAEIRRLPHARPSEESLTHRIAYDMRWRAAEQQPYEHRLASPAREFEMARWVNNTYGLCLPLAEMAAQLYHKGDTAQTLGQRIFDTIAPGRAYFPTSADQTCRVLEPVMEMLDA
jgi:hypothetical protein